MNPSVAQAPAALDRTALRPSGGARLLWILVGTGVALRVAQYLSNRSLWYDEAALALNILQQPLPALLQTLRFNQAAPPGFLLVDRLAVELLGNSEYVLRLPPLLAGIASLFLFRFVAARGLSPNAVPIALGLFAVSDPLIYFSSELKQYSSDVAIALMLFAAALRAAQEEGRRGSGTLLLALLGALALWFSHPALFVLAGIGVTLGVSALVRRDRAAARALFAAIALWIASFVALYLVSLRHVAQSEVFPKVWSTEFMPLLPRSLGDLSWLPTRLLALFRSPAGLGLPGLGVFAFLVGAWALLVKDRRRLALFLSPLLFALIASALHKYPFAGRLLLFLVPSILLLVAEGALRVREATRRSAPFVGVAMIGLLLLHPVAEAGYRLLRPRSREELRPVVIYVRDHRRDSDRIYVYHAAAHAFEYYSERCGLGASGASVGAESYGWDGYRRDLEMLRGGGRTWFLFSHISSRSGVDDEKLLLLHLDGMGPRLDSFQRPGASAYLYDLGGATPRAKEMRDEESPPFPAGRNEEARLRAPLSGIVARNPGPPRLCFAEEIA